MSTFSSFGVEVAAESEDAVEAPATPNVVQAMEDSAVASPSGFTRGSGSILGKRGKAAMSSYSPRATQLQAEAEIEAISPAAGSGEYITVGGETPEAPPSYLSIGGDDESEAPAESEYDAAAAVLAAKASEPPPPPPPQKEDVDTDDEELPAGPDPDQFKVSPVRTVVVGKNGSGRFGFQVGNGLDVGLLPCMEGVENGDINFLTDERPLTGDIILNINGENALLLTHSAILAMIGASTEVTLQVTTANRAVARDEHGYIELKQLLATKTDDEATAPYKDAVTGLVHSLVPWTTRPKREGEKNNREYHFVDHAAFLIKLKQGAFYEYAVHPDHGYYYGTPLVTDVQLARDEPAQRTAALEKRDSARANEAKVGDLHFDGAVPAGQSVSEFLATSDSKNADTMATREKLKTSIYDKTVPYTTRAPRVGEVDGTDYNFVSAQEFQDMLEDDLFLETGSFHGFSYGTKRITAAEANSSFSKTAEFQKLSGRNSGEATISELMEPTEFHGHHELELTGGLTITEFLKSVGPDNVELGAFHSAVVREVKRAVHPMTTRPPREGEVDGVDYHFVSQDDFAAHLANHDFLETGKGPDGVHSYGTLKPTAIMLGYDRNNGGAPDSHTGSTRIDRLSNNTGIPETPIRPDRLATGEHSPHPALAPANAAEQDDLYASVVPITTRDRRSGELPGLSYEFVTVEQFRAAVDTGKLAEYGAANGMLYGTPNAAIGMSSLSVAQFDHTAATVGQLFAAGLVDEAVLPAGCPKGRLMAISLAGFDEVVSGCEEYEPVRAALSAAIQSMAVPLTTRARRANELPGQDYHFVKAAHFTSLVDAKKLFEFGEHAGNWYGTPIPAKTAFHADSGKAKMDRRVKIQPSFAEASAQSVCDAYDVELAPEHGGLTISELLSVLPRQLPVFQRLHRAVHDNSVPFTTREMKPWEKNGDEYHFISRAAFMAMAGASDFFEFGGAGGVFYGTKRLPASFGTQAAVSRVDRVAERLALHNEATVGDVVGPASMYFTMQEAEQPLSIFFAGQSPQTMDQIHGDVFDVLSANAMCVAKAHPSLTQAIPEFAKMIPCSVEEFESLAEQDRYILRNTALIRVERDGVVEGQYVDYGIMKVHKVEDADMLVLTQQEFAARQNHQDTVDSLTDSAALLQSKIEQVKGCLTARTSSSDAADLMALIGKLESIVAVGATAEDVNTIAAGPGAAASGAAAAAAVATDEPASEKMAALQAELADAKKANRAYSAYVAQLEAGAANTVPVMSAGAIVKRAESYANGELSAVAATSAAKPVNAWSPVKQRMAARRMEQKAKSPEQAKKWNSMLKGVGSKETGELSPLKKKLQERRKAKAAGARSGLPPVMASP